MLHTEGQTEKTFAGCSPSASPTVLPEGVFSLCSGGVPSHGAFLRLPGKSIRDVGLTTGTVYSIYQLGEIVVVQTYAGIAIFDLKTLAPNEADYLYDNAGNQVFDNQGVPVVV